MNEEIKRAWLTALRSGEYQQGRQALRRDNAFCCLGILCDLHRKAGLGEWHDGKTETYYDGDPSGLSRSVQAWAELDGRYPLIGGVDIAELNDGAEGDDEKFPTILPHSFAEIADLIEARL